MIDPKRGPSPLEKAFFCLPPRILCRPRRGAIQEAVAAFALCGHDHTARRELCLAFGVAQNSQNCRSPVCARACTCVCCAWPGTYFHISRTLELAPTCAPMHDGTHATHKSLGLRLGMASFSFDARLRLGGPGCGGRLAQRLRL